MKDNFSAHADQYAKFRPVYPVELYEFLLNHVRNKNIAWDCATGNGQVAIELSKHFEKVYATDISEKQISNATKAENIFYKIEPAEKTSFPNDYFDLITVAQAIHWFNFELFYREVNRTIKNNGLFAAISYGLCYTGDETDSILKHFYEEITAPYWDPERKYIDDKYSTIPFPFKDIKTPALKHEVNWNTDMFFGFLDTWSAVQHFKKKTNQNPVDLIKEDVYATWGKNEYKNFTFPVFFRAALIEK